MTSIRARLIALFVVVTTTTLVIFAIYEQMVLYRQQEARFRDLQEDVVIRLQQDLADPVWVLDQGVIDAKLEAALIPPDVVAVYLFDPERKEISAGVVRDEDGLPAPSRSLLGVKGVTAEVDIYPPAQVDETRREISIGRVVVYFSRDRLERALWNALALHTLEVLTMNLLLLVVLTLSLRMVFRPLSGLRDALFALASDDGEDLKELPKTHRTEFDEVIDGFNLTLRKLKSIILRRSQAEAEAVDATRTATEALAQVKAAQEALIEKNKQLQQLTITDRLTGINNRLKLDQVLEEELHRSQRYGSVFSLVLVDIDHFKAVNDTHGHQVGDQVLIELARLLAEETRNVDVVGRWGGEEFLVVCPDTAINGAMDLAEKLRQSVGEHRFPVVARMTASFGVASVRPGDSIHLMIARADGALYQSKEAGRNRVASTP